MKLYKEPALTYLVLDYCKPIETRICLESIKRHTKFEHKVIYYHNGNSADYPYQLFKEGLIDQFIQTKKNEGLGIGTRDLVAACFSPYFFMLQNDQFLFRDFTQEEFDAVTDSIGTKLPNEEKYICSVSLAGSPCGKDVYSERGHIMATVYYRHWENTGKLGPYGAGPLHDGEWREAQIQKMYRDSNLSHFEWKQLVADNGVYAVRDMHEGGIWCHRTDNKKLWNIVPPTVLDAKYPVFNEEDAKLAIMVDWPDAKIPTLELPHSFNCWPQTQADDAAYVAKLRSIYSNKH